VRIERIEGARIGRLDALDTGPDALPGLVVVLGPNESGKSSLFTLLTSLLYGFFPATRERHPHSPWSGQPMEGRLHLRTDGGEALELHRRLLASPWGRLSREQEEVELANRPIPHVGHVPRNLFTQIYALGLTDLAGLRTESWEAVHDRLVETMGARDLKPPRVVAEELDAEADALWRGDRRGRPAVRVLQEEIRTLKARRREAAARDRRIRERIDSLAGIEVELERVRGERQSVRAREEHLASLVPLWRQHSRIGELEAFAGDLGELEGLPTDPVTRLADLDAAVEALRARLSALEAATETPRRRLDAYGGNEAVVLEREAEIEAAVEDARKVRDDRERLRASALELRKIGREVAPAAAALFTAPLTREEAEAILEFPLDDFRKRLAAVQRARGIRMAREEALHAASDEGDEEERRPAARLVPIPWWSLLVGAILLLIMGLIAQQPVLYVGAAAVLAASVVLFFGERASHRSFRQGQSRVVEEARRGVSAARKAEEEALHQARDPLRFLPFLHEILMDPGPEVAERLETLQLLLGRHREGVAEVRNRRTVVTRGARRIRALTRELGLGTGLRPDPSVRLRNALVQAREAREGARGAEEALEGVEAARDEVRLALTAAQERWAALRGLLEALGDGDVGKGATRAEERLRAARSAMELRAEMERAHPDLQERLAEIRAHHEDGEGWIREGRPPESLRLKGEELQSRVEELTGSAAEIREEVRGLERGETVEEIDGSILEYTRRIEEHSRERDRKILMARLLRDAERRFREEHQPDLIRRASEHLQAITGGRYHRLLLGEEGPGSLYLRGGGAPHALKVESPLSTGTREQVYLSLRLAVVDHLDEGRERLPLFLDEALVNWDRTRRARGLDRLASLSEQRQFFVFTCHDEMAGELQERGARILALEGVE
jgi:uncharacterized protein YhaN